MEKENSNWVRIKETFGTLPVPKITLANPGQVSTVDIPLPMASANMDDSAGNKQVQHTTYCANGKVLHSGLSRLLTADFEPASKVLEAYEAGFATLDPDDKTKFHLGNLPSPLQQRCDEGEKSVMKRIGEWLAR